MLMGPSRVCVNNTDSKPYCACWNNRTQLVWKQLNNCCCGEDGNNAIEWKWQPPNRPDSAVVVSEDRNQVTFHPYYSSGTAAIRGDTPLKRDHHYYWEVKMLSIIYGTDVMVGLGTNKVNIEEPEFKFMSLLGDDAESYGLSYRGSVRHDATTAHDCTGFCRGSIVGVRVDMWKGTLEFYVNRKPQGISFHNLRRHPILYPMLCSTAAQSTIKLTYAASWQASLLVDAAKILAASVKRNSSLMIPPGLGRTLRNQFWLILPSEDLIPESIKNEKLISNESIVPNVSVLEEMFPSSFMNGFYLDHVERQYRLVVWE